MSVRKRLLGRDPGCDLKEDPPPFSDEQRKISTAVEHVVRHCLEKNPGERFQSARDFAFDLEALSGSSAPSAEALSPTISLRRRWVLPAAAALVLIAIGGGGGRVLLSRRASSPLPTFQQLTFKRGIVYSARFAPDGRTVIYGASWEGEVPQLYSTQAGSPESRALDVKGSIPFAVSPSTEMAISLGCHYIFLGECWGTLARIPLSGGAPREVLDNVNSADWAEDGNELAVVHQVSGKFRVEFPLGKVLYESQDGWLRSLRVSPLGGAVAFVEHSLWEGDAGAVVVMDRTGKEIVRSQFFWSVEGLGWSPKGDEVWFAASNIEQVANEIHALTLSGKDRVILRLPGLLRLHDVSRDGRLLISREVWRGRILFRGPGETKERDLSWLDVSMVTDLSPDGKYLAFSEEGEATRNAFFSYMRKTDGSPAVKLGTWGRPVFSPDHNWVLSALSVTPTADRLVLFPTGVGEARYLSSYSIQHFASWSWMPDGKEIIFAGNDGHGWRMYIEDLVGGAPRPVTPPVVLIGPETYQCHMVSPDEKYVFARDLEGKAWLYPLAGGDPRPVPGIHRDDVWINWSMDGHSGYVFRWGGIPGRVFRLDLSTGNKQPILELSPDPAGLSAIPTIRITPDGKSYAYTSEHIFSELYLVDGVR
jgi:eukaryotic-like serine/threonine-protein kinase